MKNLQVSGMVLFSTAHIRPSTGAALGGPTSDTATLPLWDRLAYTFWADYGWIIAVPEEGMLGELVSLGYPDLAQLLETAMEVYGAAYIQIDSAGPLYHGIPTYEWA